MCVVLVQNIGISTSISNTTQIRPQQLRNFMCVHCNVRGASAKYLQQHQHFQQYMNTPTALKKPHVFPLGMCVVLVPNIDFSTSISNTTQICPQHFRKVMCFHWECAWCQCQILVLAPAYPTLHKYAHSSLETSCVSTGNVRGASAKYWYQNQHIQHYTNTPTVVKKLHVCLLGMCLMLVPNIGISTSISNITQIRPQQLRNFMCVHWNVRGASAKYWYQNQHIPHYTNTPTALQKGHVCPLGMCVVLDPNMVLAPAYPTLHKYAHSTSERSCVSTGNVRGASAKYGISTSISNTTQIRPQHFRKVMCVHWECAWFYFQILVLALAYPTLHKYAHSS